MKEAVVFILDASPSMNEPYEDGLNVSKLDAAKESITAMISDLMLQSVTNEVCVIVCRTLATRHHKLAATTPMDIEEEDAETVPFPNVTELTNGVVRPSVEVLQSLQRVQALSEQEAKGLRGDFCDGIILAADALFERTNKKRYQRKVVLFTDAEHEVVMDVQQILVVIDALRSMECRLDVIGLDFERSAVYEEPAVAPDKVTSTIKQEEMEETSSKGDDDDDDDDRETDGSDDDQEVVYTLKADREKLLLSITEKTGGSVVAAKSLQQLLNENKGKRLQTATKRKMELRIAPGIVIDARYLLMMKKEGYPTMKTEVILRDEETGEAIKDEDGKELTDNVVTLVDYVDPDKPDDEVEEQDRTTAIRYGSDLVAMSVFDYEGLHSVENPSPQMQILGYMEKVRIPPVYLIGPPYAVSGADSMRACAAISALAQALQRSEKVAICTFHKSKMSADYILGALYPLGEAEFDKPLHLVFLQLPFASDARKLDLDSFDDHLKSENKEEKAKACEDLITSLMLPTDSLLSGKMPNPFLRAWNQTKVKRAINPEAGLVLPRTNDDDPMKPPIQLLERSEEPVKRFQEAFKIAESKELGASKKKIGKGRKRVLHYKDFIDE